MPTYTSVKIDGAWVFVESIGTVTATISSTGAIFTESGAKPNTYTYTYTGSGTFCGLSLTQGAAQPDSGFEIGDTTILSQTLYNLYSVTGGDTRARN